MRTVAAHCSRFLHIYFAFRYLTTHLHFTMRFSIIAAFILPLAALAAPTPAPAPAPEVLDKIDQARLLFGTAVTVTSAGINATIALLGIPNKMRIREEIRGDVLDRVNKANQKLGAAVDAAQNIDEDIKAGKLPQDSEYVDNLRVYGGQND